MVKELLVVVKRTVKQLTIAGAVRTRPKQRGYLKGKKNGIG
jgi:hypothetical protein